METKWQETPLAKVFSVVDEVMNHNNDYDSEVYLCIQWVALKLNAQSSFVVEALKSRNTTLWEAFSSFDYDNNGILSPAEVYGALKWLNFPDLNADDVADFIEAADKNRDGMIDYKEYVDMLSIATVNAKDDLDDESNDQSQSTMLSKVEPYGADEIREVMIHRKQAELAHQRAERIRRQAYKDALDVKIFEEELEASKSRKGGANPLVVTSDKYSAPDSQVRVTDYKFSTNQHPLRFLSTGKNTFLPYQKGTAADRPIKPFTCPNKHDLTPCNYGWLFCRNCNGRGIHWYCYRGGCNYYACSGCFEGDKRAKQALKDDPSKHPTFLRCSNGCSFTLQIPTAGGRCPTTGSFTISMLLRFERLPPQGSAQSLLRFSLPDISAASKQHRTSVYLSPDGRILPYYPSAASDISSSSSSSSSSASLSTMRIRPKLWGTVSIVVEPSNQSVTTYVNGRLSCFADGLDVNELQLHHRLVVLGGGKQAHVRGGDIQRLVIHGAALSPESIEAVYLEFTNDNPAIAKQVCHLQAIFRGYRYRKVNNINKSPEKESRDEQENDDDGGSDDSEED